MGLASAPGAFKNLMELILGGLSYEIVSLYLGNTIIFGRTFEEYLEMLELILSRLKEAGFRKRSKCRFLQENVFFGHIVSNNDVEVDPER